MLRRVKSLLGFGEPAPSGPARALDPQALQIEAATQLPAQPLPSKVKAKQQSAPSYLTTAKPSPESAFRLIDRQLANTDITALRTGNGSRQVIRDFVRASPDLSAAVSAYVRVGITNGFTASAKNLDGTFNPEATSALHQIITNMNVLNDYSLGYDDAPSLRALSEMWAIEILITGAMAGELVLDKARLPSKIQPIAVSQIKFYPSSDAKKLVPKQELAGLKIDLDIPTFFMTSLDQSTLEPYSIAPIEPAIQGVLFSAEFMNDVRRIIKKAIHPRNVVTIDEEKFRKSIPPDVMHDAVKLKAYMEGVLDDIESRINGLEPEDALVLFDSITIEVVDHGNTSLSDEYKVIQDMADSKVASGAKALPTVLGKAGATSNVASAETLIFMKFVEGTVWAKLNEMFSKIFTLAVRLLGHDVYVDFAYQSINLKPEVELESFRAMEQSRILDLLSLGLITDEEASVRLTGHLPPPGYENKSGTGFRSQTSNEPAGDGYNGENNSGSTLNQNLKPKTPTGAKSQNKKADSSLELVATR